MNTRGSALCWQEASYGEHDEGTAAAHGEDDGSRGMLDADPELDGLRPRGHTFEELAQQVQVLSTVLCASILT